MHGQQNIKKKDKLHDEDKLSAYRKNSPNRLKTKGSQTFTFIYIFSLYRTENRVSHFYQT